MAVLDSSFLIDLSHQHEKAVKALRTMTDQGHRLIVPALAALEYLTGLDDPVEGMRDIERGFQLVPYDKTHILRGSKLARDAYSKGRFPGWSDTCIATTALLEQEPVITADPDHFRALGCRVWDYRNEDGPDESG